MVPLGNNCGEVTTVGYSHKGPPPWEKGNCLTFRFGHKELPGRVKEGEQLRCYAVNIHAENLYEITKRLQLKAVEAEIIHKRTYLITNFYGARSFEVVKEEGGDCIITDTRIPRKWFRPEKPGCGCVSPKDWQKYVREYPEKFGVLDARIKEQK